jgi:hypothetical protein
MLASKTYARIQRLIFHICQQNVAAYTEYNIIFVTEPQWKYGKIGEITIVNGRIIRQLVASKPLAE